VSSAADRTPRISVVVCTHNGSEKLPIALRSLTRQTLAPSQYEVIVVDDGSSDDSVRVAREHAVRALRLPANAGLAAARNAGIAAAHSDLIAFTDDDCEVAADWLAALLPAFEDSNVDGVSGPVSPEADDPFVRAYLRAHNPLSALPDTLLAASGLGHRLRLYLASLVSPGPELDHLYSVVGANMAFRRSALLAVDGFDEAYRFGSEEEDLCRRLHARDGGAMLLYVPGAQVTHWFEGRISDSLRRARSYGRGKARNVFKHPEMRPIVYPVPVAVAGVISYATLTRRPRAALAAALLPLAGYPGWIRHTRSEGGFYAPLYPYVQLLGELWNMFGELEGARAGYEPVPSAHLRRTALAS
jgi:GT2 family glycosyltransferase